MVLHCVNKAVTQGAISQAQGQHLINEFDLLVQGHLATHGNPALAMAQAQASLANGLRTNARMRKVQAGLQMAAHSDLATKISNAKDLEVLLNSIFNEDKRWRSDSQSVTSLHGQVEYYNNQAMKFMTAFDRIERSFGLADDKLQRNFLKELNGISSGDAFAKELADGFKKADDYLSTHYQASGGAMSKKADFDISHVHDPVKVLNAGKDNWVEAVMKGLDRGKMWNFTTDAKGVRTNTTLMSDDQLRGLLENMWLKIVGEKTNLGETKGKASVANRHSEERILHFKDDAWFDYNSQFGKQDIINSAIKQIRSMSNDIAQMQKFGPNVELGKQFLKDAFKQEALKRELARVNSPQNNLSASLDPKSLSEKSDGQKFIDSVDKEVDKWFDVANGKIFATGDLPINHTLTSLRNTLAAAQLGCATLGAVGDFGTMGWTSIINGIPVVKVLQNYMKGLTSNEYRHLAAELGLVIDHLHSGILDSVYHINEIGQGINYTKLAADKTMKWSGLERHTNAARQAMALTFAGEIARNFANDFASLDAKLQRGLKVNGITPHDWDIIRSSTPYQHNGSSFVNLADVERLDNKVALKLNQYLTTERDKAIITSGWGFDKAFADMNIKGELGKAISMYKRWPALMLANLVGRLRNEEMSLMERGLGAAGFTLTMTVLGAVTLSLKDIVSGRDPRSWDSKGFWFDAFLAGGAGGILSDYTRNIADGFKTGRIKDIAQGALFSTLGAVAGYANDGWLVPVTSFIHDSALGTKSTKDAFKGMVADMSVGHLKNLPFNNLWYSKVFVDRWLEEGVRKLIDPEADRLFARQISNRLKNYNSSYWWKPSQVLPDRLPDFGTNG